MLVVIVVGGRRHRLRFRPFAAAGSPTTEDEPVPSRLFAPSGLIPTAAEKEVQKQWDELPRAHDSRTPDQLVLEPLMGDNHYRRYVDHRGATHPGEPVMSERDYWRMRHDATERSPQSRCC